jgi:hypothetical protein
MNTITTPNGSKTTTATHTLVDLERADREAIAAVRTAEKAEAGAAKRMAAATNVYNQARLELTQAADRLDAATTRRADTLKALRTAQRRVG